MRRQMSLNERALRANDHDAFREVLTRSKLRALEPRDVLFQALRFEKHQDRYFAAYAADYTSVSVGVLASLSSQILVSIMRLFMATNAINPRFHDGGFDGINAHAYDADSSFWATRSDILIVFPAVQDIRSWPRLFADADEINTWVQQQAQPLLSIWAQSRRVNPSCQIYTSVFVEPLARQLGNLEAAYPFSRTRCLRLLNQYLMDHRPPNVTMLDFEYLSAMSGKNQWFDDAAYFTTKQPFSIRLMPMACDYVTNLIAVNRGQIRKCLVVDLDNTIWGGVIGDDGLSGLRLSPSDPLGEAFLAFQSYLLALRERGVLLAACSKNDENLARSVFADHPDMILKEADFAVFIANWDDKATNIRRIASELNLGTDSLVFFDDNPAEREIVAQFEPSVLVIDVPADPALFIRALQNSFAFEWLQLTLEDRERAKSYDDNKARSKQLSQFADYSSYLKSLEMRATVRPATMDVLPRFQQLVNKTNQFNCRTRRYGDGELSALLNCDDYHLLDVVFSDKFTNFGSVANVILRKIERYLFIENWVMSCRVFKRGLEDATFDAIVTLARQADVDYIAGEYIETAKNSYVKSLFPEFGFLPWDDESLEIGAGGQRYRLDVRNIPDRTHHISTEMPLDF
jgi:FkbH-like protein